MLKKNIYACKICIYICIEKKQKKVFFLYQSFILVHSKYIIITFIFRYSFNFYIIIVLSYIYIYFYIK